MTNRRTLSIGGMLVALLTGVAWFATAGERGNTQQADTWPPQFPRPGATKVFENDKVIIWDERYSPEPYFHRHVRDVIAFRIEDGGGVVVDYPDGRSRSDAQEPQKSPAGLPRFSSYAKAGGEAHSERSADPKRLRRNIWVELKGTEPPGVVNGRLPK